MAQRVAHGLLDDHQRHGDTLQRKDNTYRLARTNKTIAQYKEWSRGSIDLDEGRRDLHEGLGAGLRAIIDFSERMSFDLQEADRSLTPAQAAFARENRAVLVPSSFSEERVVRLYRVGPMLTRRWLIDEEGNVIEFDAFPRTV
jgi:hypothetical protein